MYKLAQSPETSRGDASATGECVTIYVPIENAATTLRDFEATLGVELKDFPKVTCPHNIKSFHSSSFMSSPSMIFEALY